MYQAYEKRYESIQYRYAGRSGLKLPALSLGLWKNFSEHDSFITARDMILGSFDLGISHFDIANIYGQPPGSAEELFGRILHKDLGRYRDELIISTKAGSLMWSGPYGNWGSRKHILSSLDQSLVRLGIDYVDIFYHHRPDPSTPVEETMDALAYTVKSGKAIYIGISNYSVNQTKQAIESLKRQGIPLLVHQLYYNLLNRQAECGLYDLLSKEGIAATPYSPLAQGVLTGKYLNGIPDGSRAANPLSSLRPDDLNDTVLDQVQKLGILAQERGQTLAQMAISWLLRSPVTSSVIIGASHLSQVQELILAQNNTVFSSEESAIIDEILRV